MKKQPFEQNQYLIKGDNDNLFVLSQMALLSFQCLIFIISSSISNQTSDLIIFLGLVFVSICLFTSFMWWSHSKLTFKQDDIFNKTGRINNRFHWILSGLIYCISMIGAISSIFSMFIAQIYLDLNRYLLVILSILIVLMIFLDIRRVSKRPEMAPNNYLNKFLLKTIESRDQEYHYSFTTVLFFSIIIILLPMVIIYLTIVNNVELVIILWTIILVFLYGGYWTGYGAYRSYRWLWGLSTPVNQTEVKISKFNQLGLRYSLEISFGIITNFYLVFIGFLIFFIQLSLIQPLEPWITILISIGLFTGLIKLLLQVISSTSRSQPWYSFLFLSFISIIPFFWITTVMSLLNDDQAPKLITKLLSQQEWIPLLLCLAFWVGLFIMFISNSRHMQYWIWKDLYESTQLLNEINLKLSNPKPLHLNLLTKISVVHQNTELISKLLQIYQKIIENEILDEEKGIIDSLASFIITQIQIEHEWSVHAISFEIAHQLIDKNPEYIDNFFIITKKIADHVDPKVRQAAINLFGHIMQINPNINKIQEIYPIIEQIYYSADDQDKKENIQAFKFIIMQFESFRERIFGFFLNRLELETFGVSIEIFSLFESLMRLDPNKFKLKLYNLSETVLETLDHPAKLGTIQFLANNFPNNPQEGAPFIRLFMNNLKDVENTTGVRPNILYMLGDLMPKIPELINLLPDLDILLDDEDPDVTTALIQVGIELYLQEFVSKEILHNYITAGLSNQDHIARLVTIQSVRKKIKFDVNLLKFLGDIIIDRGLKDDSTYIREETITFLEDYKDIIPKEWISSLIMPQINIETDSKLKKRLGAIIVTK
ncbi:MAG: hypothetical protein ACXAC7_13240 [Candidatus Hodarchaeales archaeon]